MKDTRELERRLLENGDSMKVTATKPSEQYLADVMTKLYAGIFYEAAAALASQREELERLREALTHIRRAQPDQLDHSIDVSIIERAAYIARAALSPLPAAPATEKGKP